MVPAGRIAEVLRRPRMRRRLVVMSDQAASSLSNVVAAVLVARSFDSPEPFGAFGLAMIAYQLIIGGSKSLIGHPLLSLYSPLDAEARRRVVPDLQGAALCIGFAGSLVVAAASALLGGMSGSALLALAVVLPLVLVHDTWRFSFVVDRPGAALAIDLVWLLAVVAAFPLAPADAGVAWYVMAWGLGGGLGALVGVAIAGGFGGRPRPLRWLSGHRQVGGRYFGEYLTAQATGRIVASTVGAFAGLGALGAVKASEVYYGPHHTLHMGIYMAVVPEGAQTRDQPERLRRMLKMVSLGLATLSTVWMGVGLAIPESWGEELFGATWAGAREIMLPMGVAMVAAGVTSGGLMGLRSLADARRSLRARLHIVPWQTVCPLVGAATGGAWGFAVGLAIGRIAGAAIMWRAFDRSLREGVEVPDLPTPASQPARPALSLADGGHEQ